MRKLALLAASVVLVAVLLTGAAAATLSAPAGAGGLKRDADIPAELVPIIEAAAGAYCDLRPALLAGVFKAESDFGRDPDPSVHRGANGAGAAGPLQIGIGGKAGNTWGGTPVRAVPPTCPTAPTATATDWPASTTRPMPCTAPPATCVRSGSPIARSARSPATTAAQPAGSAPRTPGGPGPAAT